MFRGTAFSTVHRSSQNPQKNPDRKSHENQSNIINYFSRTAIISLLLAGGQLHADDILFLDTFNRPNSTTTDGTGLNESTDGKSGTLGALTWTGVTALNSTGNVVDIDGNRLRMNAVNTNGNNGGLAYISNHNFTDANIKAAGTFSVSVDITSSSSAGEGRALGFGVGSSLAELEAVNSASPGNNPSDVYFTYDNVGSALGLRVYHNGKQGTGLLPFPSGTPSPPDTLLGVFTFADMNAGSTLDYEFFIDGISVVTGSTTWSGTDENYLCLESNYSNASFFDNFMVTVPGPPVIIATNPADGATNIAPFRNLTATFDEPIFLGDTGSITIKNLTTSTNTVISLPGPDPDGTLSVSGNILTIAPTANLGAAGDELSIEISADAIKDTDDLFYAGLLSTDDPNWSFTIDNTPPAPNFFHPLVGSGNAPLDGALFIFFNENLVIGSGNLMVYRADGTLVETIDVTSENVSVTGASITITPTVALAAGTSYYVLIDSSAIMDAAGNGYGISDPTVWTFTTVVNDPTILFGDSFNRSNSTNLNESASGKYGSLGALNYTSRVIGAGNVQLSLGQLLIQSNEPAGQSGGLVYINDHNFTDAAITAGGGFSITVDINAYTTQGSGRYISVGVGQSLVALDEQTTSSATGSVGDLVVGYRNTTGALEIFKNGAIDATESVSSGLPVPPTKMRIDYSVSDFNANSAVNYSVFFDDNETAFTSGSFTWSGTEENYISLSSNLFQNTTAGVRNAMFDNLQIRTLGSGGDSGFDTWKTTNGAIGQTLDEDHDGDGVSNGIEYFIGGPNGNTSGFTPLPTVTNSGGTLSVTWTKGAGYAGVYGSDFVVETSSTLTADSWTTETLGVNVTITGNDVTYTFPAGVKNFARLVVTGP